MLSILSCAPGPSVCPPWRDVYLGLPLIFWLGCLFFWYWAPWAVCIFWRLIICCFICKYFLPFWGLSFHLFMVSFAVQMLLSWILAKAFSASIEKWNKDIFRGFPGGAVVKNPPANAGTQVQALVWEDPTCHRATKPVCHNYWAHVPQLLKPMCLEPMLCNKRSHRNESSPATKSSPHSPQLEKARVQQRRPNTAKNKNK